jgi:hypothetical protein
LGARGKSCRAVLWRRFYKEGISAFNIIIGQNAKYEGGLEITKDIIVLYLPV